ncbi:MAG TPA: iron-sulfur cluster repair protein YtfE [Telmatospirillum sp.]|nr:iron-sulfur cluster repair protein YtfE [Telmatospirillum sp.]
MHDSLDGNSGLAARTLGEIATTLPGATAIFRRHKLDFCCGGAISLAEATKRKNLDLKSVENELAALVASKQAIPEEPEALIERIVERYHDVHRRELPELVLLAQRVEHVHAARPEVPVGLAAALAEMTDELCAHMQKEEQILFPMMRRGGNPMIGHPIGMMRHEHTEHGERLDALSVLANDFEPPADACGTWRALYVGLRKLSDDLMDHIHLENNILFPQFNA